MLQELKVKINAAKEKRVILNRLLSIIVIKFRRINYYKANLIPRKIEISFKEFLPA